MSQIHVLLHARHVSMLACVLTFGCFPTIGMRVTKLPTTFENISVMEEMGECTLHRLNSAQYDFVTTSVCACRSQRSATPDPMMMRDRDSVDDLATIKIVRGPGAEPNVPKISTKLGVVTYGGHKAIINEDNSVRFFYMCSLRLL